jgi:hypothetical protein
VLGALAGVVAGQVIHETIKLVPADVQETDVFGYSVAVQGSLALIGAISSQGAAVDSGTVYIFDISDPANPVQLAEFFSAGGQAGDRFGAAVDLDGGLALVGADLDDTGTNWNIGAAYIFDVSDPTTPIERAQVLPTGLWVSGYFGASVSINNGVGVVGSPFDNSLASTGAAYIYDLADPASPILANKLLNNPPSGFSDFGDAVSLSSGLLAVGDPARSEPGLGTGAAFVYDISDPYAPNLAARLLPADVSTCVCLGDSVAIDDGAVLVGAPHSSMGGSSYLFDLADPGAPLQMWKLQPDSISAQLGDAVAIDAQRLVVGAAGEQSYTGAAYLFDRHSGGLIAKLVPSDGAPSDFFGYAVAVSGDTVLVSAPWNGEFGERAGAVYIFDLSPGGCNAADLAEPYGVLDLADINAFIAGFLSSDPIADLNSDGIHDLADIGVFVSEFVAGCP